jgi:scyllo-inositol 2-dehydrogenase (NADP+)
VSGTLGVALIGYGLAGEAFHAPLVDATPGLALRAVVTQDAEKADRVRARYPDARVVDDAASAWAHADIAVVAAVNRVHVELALGALEAGLAVVIDKPLAVDAAGARRVAEAAASAGRPAAVFHNRRWDADFSTLRRIVADGELGPVHAFESRFDRWRPEPKAGAWRERGGAEEGGGVLLDLGPHLVDQALVLLGPAETVYAEVAARRDGVEADDDVFLALRHAGGAVSHLWAGLFAGDEGRRIRAAGARGVWVHEGSDPQEAALRAGTRPDVPGWGEADGGLIVRGDERRAITGTPGDYGAFYRAVAAAVLKGTPVPVPLEDAVRVMEILDAARASAARREVVSL